MKRMKLLFTLALPVFLLQNAQAQSSRLVAMAHWYNNGTTFWPIDTTAYTYGAAGRGGDLTHQMKYDNSETWVATDTSVNPSTMVTQTFDLSNRLTSATTQTYDVFAGHFNNTSKANYFYDATTGMLSSMIFQTWGGSSWTNVSEDVYTYDGSNHLFTDVYETWSGVAFNAVSQKQYYYSGSNKIQEVDQTLVSGTYTPTARWDYAYATGTSWLTSTTYSIWGGASFTPSYMYTNTYDSATGNRLTQTYQTYSMGSPMNVSLKTYTSWTSTGNLPTAEVDQNWDTSAGGSYMNHMSITYSYNGHNQLTQSVGESWNAAGFWEFAYGDPMANYYYSDYTSSEGVKTVASVNGDVNVYPNPVQSTINLSVNWAEAQEFSVSIFDMKGALVAAWKVPATAQYTTQISTDNYNAGVYVIRIGGSKGQISKEVVVAH